MCWCLKKCGISATCYRTSIQILAGSYVYIWTCRHNFSPLWMDENPQQTQICSATFWLQVKRKYKLYNQQLKGNMKFPLTMCVCIIYHCMYVDFQLYVQKEFHNQLLPYNHIASFFYFHFNTMQSFIKHGFVAGKSWTQWVIQNYCQY